MYEYNLFSQQGWECPKCGSILSPSMMWCPFCSGKKEVTYSTTTDGYIKGEDFLKIFTEPQTEDTCKECVNKTDCAWK